MSDPAKRPRKLSPTQIETRKRAVATNKSEWNRALSEFFERHNSQVIADLLRGNKKIPPVARQTLAALFDPADSHAQRMRAHIEGLSGHQRRKIETYFYWSWAADLFNEKKAKGIPAKKAAALVVADMRNDFGQIRDISWVEHAPSNLKKRNKQTEREVAAAIKNEKGLKAGPARNRA